MKKILMLLICLLAFSMVLTSCDSSGSGSGGGDTPAETSYEIEYNGNYTGSINLDSEVVSYLQEVQLPNYSTRTGYTFTGWNTKADGTGTAYTAGQKVSKLSSEDGATVILYAQWSENSYTLVFDGNGATSGTTAPWNLRYTQSANMAGCGFIRTDYDFKKWNTEADGSGTDYEAGDVFSKLASEDGATVTVYAQWAYNP